MGSTKLAHFSPGRTIFFTMFLTIFVGSLALALPAARTIDIPFIDLFFTATSATCVTGLFTIPLENFTFLGHCILLGLIQVGGLGLITLMLFIMTFFLDMGLATQLMAGQLLEIDSWKHIKKIIIFIIGLTVFTEVAGALIILPLLLNYFPGWQALFLSLFHAVSSFCNAGIDLFPNSMELFGTSYVLLLTTSALIFCGGLGFITWYEIMQYLARPKDIKHYVFSLQSKIIFYWTAGLVSMSTLVFWLLEYNNALSSYSYPFSFVSSLFHVLSFRSTGFSSFSLGSLNLATILMIMVIAFIGSSPVSTGSGIKITTLAVFLSTVKAAISGKTSVNIRGRKLPKDQIYKAIAIVAIGISWILLATFLMLIIEKNHQFLTILFEVVAAFTTIGISTGITGSLSVLGKILIILSMIIGRIGSFTLILGLRFKKKPETSEFSYPEERVILS